MGPSVFAAPWVTPAGTLTVTTLSISPDVIKYTLAWTSTAGGAVSANSFGVRRGRLLQVKFVPGASTLQPTDAYDITLTDADSVDLLAGQGANLSNANSSRYQWNPALYFDGTESLDLVVANAGSAKSGTVYLWVSQ